MVILGGIGNIWGAVVGAVALDVRRQDAPALDRLPASATSAPILPNPAEYNFLIYGLILVVMMRFRPQGFLPSRQRAAE